jgi:hypothetical protein
MLNLDAKKLQYQHCVTFHALRRSAASLAFKAGILLEQNNQIGVGRQRQFGRI